MSSVFKYLLLIAVISVTSSLVFATSVSVKTRTCGVLFSRAVSMKSLMTEFAGIHSANKVKKAYKAILESNNPEIISSLAFILAEAEPSLGYKTTKRDINIFKDFQGIESHGVRLTDADLSEKYDLSKSYIQERIRRIKQRIEILILDDLNTNNFATYSKPFIELLKERSIILYGIRRAGLQQKLKDAGLSNKYPLKDVLSNIEMLKYVVKLENQEPSSQQLKESVALIADFVIKDNQSIENNERVYSIFMRFLRVDPENSIPLVRTVASEYGISSPRTLAIRDKALMELGMQLKKAYADVEL